MTPAKQTYIQPIDNNNLYTGKLSKVFAMIDNYVYLYHTNTLIVLPTYPESISDAMSAQFSPTTPISRSAPIYSFTSSGPRSFAVSLTLHREMLNSVNIANSNLKLAELSDNDYVDTLINQLHAIALPRYAAADKMVNPPLVAVKIGSDIFCKGVVNGGVTHTFSGPILRTNKYAMCNVDFTLSETDPYDADTVMACGSYRGLSMDLEGRVWKTGSSKRKGGIT